MSMTNESNRPQMSAQLGAVSATKEVGLLAAHKKLKLRQVSLMDISAIAASGVDYLSLQLKKNGVLIGAVVDTQAGLAARELLDLDLGEDQLLEKGDRLSLQMTVAGVGALTEASLHMDYEVIGN